MSSVILIAAIVGIVLAMLAMVIRLSKGKGKSDEALKQANKSMDRTRKYLEAASRPLYRGRGLVDKLRSWSDRGSD